MPTAVTRVGGNLPNGNFIPEVWSKKLQAKFYASTCLAEVTNNDWEGEIKARGSKVQIRVRPTIVVEDYDVNGVINYQDLEDDKIELTIDRAKYTAFKVDDVDAAQADIKIVNESTQDGAEQMTIKVEKDVFGSVYADATTQFTNTQITKDTVMDWLIDLETTLDDLNIPYGRRFVVLPNWVAGFIKKSDLVDASITHGDLSLVTAKGAANAGLQASNGYMGMISNFRLYKSNNLTTDGTNWHAISGSIDAITFASQFTKSETIRLQDTFGDAIRSLKVYGFKTVAPDALVHAEVHK
jgi:hypothetical protein